MRVETRIPGGDVNPYLAFAATIAAGLHGIENELELPPALEGNAYESSAERFPSTLREAIAALEDGSMARAAFGDDVVEHYLNYARTEQESSTGRHVLGAGAALRAWVSRSSASRRTSRAPRGARGTSTRRSCRRRTCAAVVRAGGAPLLVPPGAALEETLDARRRAVFSGGSDLDPELYGAEAHRGDGRASCRERDDFELALMRAALERDVPVLAICRGSQVLNVALGGDLEQHVPDRVGTDAHKRDAGRVRRARRRRSSRGTRLAAMLGDRHDVKSHHHQGYGALGERAA